MTKWKVSSLELVFLVINSNHLGPDLPIPLNGHTESTVPLGHGQAILGGLSTYITQKKIYVINCQRRNCFVSTMIQELSFPRSYFVAIPIPDNLAGCVTGGRKTSIITICNKVNCPRSKYFLLQTA